MSKIKLTGHASGSGVLTIAAPNTDSDRTITLPDVTGTLLDSGSDLPAANLTGTVADARISALTASKLTGALPALDGSALTGIDLESIRRDIATLALHSAVADNKAAYNLPNSFIDQFEDDTGLGTQTNVDRSSGEYVSSVITGTLTGSFTSMSHSNFSVQSNWTVGGNNITMGTSPDNDTGSHTGQGSSTIEFGANRPFQFKAGATYNNSGYGPFHGFRKTTSSTLVQAKTGQLSAEGEFFYNHGSNRDDPGIYVNDGAGDGNDTRVYANTNNSGQFVGVERTAAGIFKLHWSSSNNIAFDNSNNTLRYTFTNAYTGAYYFIISGQGGHRSDLDNLTYDLGSAQTTNATGTLISTAQTASSAQTKVSGVILYKNNAGTATLGTDLKVYFTCNGGTNWTESTPAAAGTFSTGILMAKCPEVTCTSGTDVRYKVVWANQAAGSKETQLYGIAMNY